MGKDQSSRQTSLPDKTGMDDTSREGMSRRKARPPPVDLIMLVFYIYKKKRIDENKK